MMPTQHHCILTNDNVQMSVYAVKQKLMSHTGSSPSSMQLQLKDESGNLLSHLSNDSKLLGYYSPYNGYVGSLKPFKTPSHSIDVSFVSQVAQKYLCHALQLDMLHRCILHVTDTDVNSKSASGWLEDTSKVKKYVMSDEDYAKRENTYKQYKHMKQQVWHHDLWQPVTAVCFRRAVFVPAGGS